MQNDRQIILELAKQYAEIAANPINVEREKLYRGINDLKMIRPVVLIDELPWSELNINDELTTRSTSPVAQNIEWFFRSIIYKWKHLQADMIVSPHFPVFKRILTTGNGFNRKEETLASDSGNSIVSHAFEDQFLDDSALEKFHKEIISYDEKSTLQEYEQVSDLIGDAVLVKIVGTHIGTGVWDDISVLRGVTNLLYDLIERPEFTHEMVRIMTEINRDKFRQYEELNLFEAGVNTVHCTPALSEKLPTSKPLGENVKLGDIWGRAVAQIFASVSPDMHDEFDIEYVKSLMEPFGLVYYGCCEPLDRKIDILEKIPNLRKISITPWADVDNAAEKIGRKYVLSSKPNPSSVAVSKLDEAAVRDELTKIISACQRNNCAVDIVLKDISSVGHNPENIFKWERIAMELVGAR